MVSNSNNQSVWVLSGIGAVVAILLVLTLILFKFETVHGNQIGVLETWVGGVDPNPSVFNYIAVPSGCRSFCSSKDRTSF